MSFKPIDPKRDEIRRYLERGSVLDSLTKIFIRVIKERPENPMEYIRNNIGVVRHQHDKYERLQQDLQLANEEIQRLRGIINSINPEALGQGQQQPSQPASDEAEVVAAPQVAEAPAETKHVQEENVAVSTAETSPELANGGAELAAAVDNCRIDEKVGVDAPKAEDSPNSKPSVQAVEQAE